MEKTLCLISWSDIEKFIPYVCGYLYAIIVGSILIKFIMDELKEKIRYLPFAFSNEDKLAYGWYAQGVGVFDLILYISAMLIGKYEFIAIWLAFKVAGRWESARLEKDSIEDDIKEASKKKSLNLHLIINNALYNIFTIGNALVLIWAGATYKSITYWNDKAYGLSILMALAVLIITLVFYFLAKKQTKRLEEIYEK